MCDRARLKLPEQGPRCGIQTALPYPAEHYPRNLVFKTQKRLVLIDISEGLVPWAQSFGGDEANEPFDASIPFGPSMLGIGFLLAFALLMRGTPWMTRGSFMYCGSNLAGTGKRNQLEIIQQRQEWV